MKKKILIPVFASVMALSVSSIVNADEINDSSQNKDDKTNTELNLGEYKEVKYKVARIKDGVAIKIREEGQVQNIAYSGDEFTVLGIQGEWVKVKVEDGEGWLATRYVDISEGVGYTNADKVNLRKDKSENSEVIGELEKGSSLLVLEENGDWLKVKDGEAEGYVKSSYVTDKAPVIEEPQVDQNVTQNGDSTNNNQQNNTNDNQQNNNSNVPTANSNAVQAVLNLAYSKQGCPYVWGAEGPNTFDCSGFTQYVYRNAVGKKIPRTSKAQSNYGQTVSKANLQPGDLVFFTTNGSGSVSHVGIYVGGGNMIHSPSTGKTVRVTSINSAYYTARFVTAKRIL
ncbi:C40 family peptidase [Clostridioides difficile]|nr:cell wall hydrolase [Clostridioides difficile]